MSLLQILIRVVSVTGLISVIVFAGASYSEGEGPHGALHFISGAVTILAILVLIMVLVVAAVRHFFPRAI